MNLEKEYKATMIALYKYMTIKDDEQIQAVFTKTPRLFTLYPRKLRST